MNATTQQPASTVPKIATVEMVKPADGDKGGSVRFNATEKGAALNNAYVSRSFVAINGANRIRVTVEVIG